MTNTTVALASGGKDSTAMLILLAEAKKRLDYVVFNDTGIEFPQTVEFVRKKLDPFVYSTFGIHITGVRPKTPFGLLVKKWGVPHVPKGRWCYRHLKREPLWEWLREIGARRIELFQGYTRDEIPRYRKARLSIQSTARRYGILATMRAPLIESGLSEDDAMRLAAEYGLLNPLYKYRKRLSCYLCPFQSIDDWRNLYLNFPRLFNTAQKLEELSIKLKGKSFSTHWTLSQLRERFERERRQTKLIEVLQ